MPICVEAILLLGYKKDYTTISLATVAYAEECGKGTLFLWVRGLLKILSTPLIGTSLGGGNTN